MTIMKINIIVLLLTIFVIPVFGQTDTSEIIRKCRYKHSQSFDEQEQNIQTLGFIYTQDSYLTIAKYLLSDCYERVNLAELFDVDFPYYTSPLEIKDTIPEDETDTIFYEVPDYNLFELEEKRIMEEMTRDNWVRRYIYDKADFWISELKNPEILELHKGYINSYYESDSKEHCKSTKVIRKRLYKWLKKNYGRYEF